MKRLNRLSFAFLTLTLISVSLAGCATESGGAWVKPIYLSKQDVLTRGTKQQVLTHNETWEKTKK